MILLSNFFILLLSCSIILGADSSTAENAINSSPKEQKKPTHNTSGLLDHILHFSTDDTKELESDANISENDDEIQIKPTHPAAEIVSSEEKFAPIESDIFNDIGSDLKEETAHMDSFEEKFDTDVAAQENTIITAEQDANPKNDTTNDAKSVINKTDSDIATNTESTTENNDVAAAEKKTTTVEDKLDDIKDSINKADSDIAINTESETENNDIAAAEKNTPAVEDKLDDIKDSINKADSDIATNTESETENNDVATAEKKTPTAEDKLDNIKDTISKTDSDIAINTESETENNDVATAEKKTPTAEDKLDNIKDTISKTDSDIAINTESETENNDVAAAEKKTPTIEDKLDNIKDTINKADSAVATNAVSKENSSATEKEIPTTQITSSKNIKKDSSKLKINTTNKVLTNEAIPANNLAIDKKTVANIMQNTQVPDIVDTMSTEEDMKITPLAKPIQNPFLIKGAEFFNNANYNGNQHLTEPTYIEEYYQLLFATILTEDTEGVKAITSKIGTNYDIFVENLSPLTYAIKNNNNPDIIRQMLSLGYAPNSTDLNNKSPLYYAVELQKYDFAIELLLWGANPNFGAEEEITPFDLAMHNDDTIMLDILRRAEID